MDIRQNIVNKIGCAVVWWILHNCSDGLAIKRKGGAEQVIKVFSVQAYRNIIKPIISPKHSDIKVGDVVTAPYHGQVVVTRIRGNLIDGYYRADGVPVSGLEAGKFKKLVGYVDVKVGG